MSSKLFTLALLLLAFFRLNAAVTITTATGGTCLNVSPGAYTTLGAITITEGINNDFGGAQAAGTYTIVLNAPANFEFNTGATPTFTESDGDLTTPVVVSITASAITLSVIYDGASGGGTGSISISGIQVRATSSGVLGNITRGSAGTNLTITGDAPGAGVNHGSLTSGGATYTSTSAGNWTNGATWVGGVAPSCANDIVVINHAVTADAARTVNNLTINTGGNLTSTNAVTVNGTFTIAGTGTYTHNNFSAASTTIFNGTESFTATSSIIVNAWSSGAVPFPTGVSSNFGNVTLNSNIVWEQNGLFSTNQIQGNLSVTAGSINFDGVGVSTGLTIGGNVSLTSAGTHSLYSASSVPASYTLNMGSLTQAASNNFYMFVGAGSSGQSCAITINSNTWNISGDFFVATSCLNTPTCSQSVTYDVTVNIIGDMNFSGATAGDRFDIVYLSVGDCDVDVNVSGDINVTSAPGWYHFNDLSVCTGDLFIDCNDMSISHGVDNDFAKGSGPVTITCSGNYSHSGAATLTNFLQRTSGGSNVIFSCVNTTMSGGTWTINDGGDGTVTYTNTGNVTQSGGVFYGHTGNGNYTETVSGNYTHTAGSAYLTGEPTLNANDGDLILSVNGVYRQDAGTFYGASQTGTNTGGNVTFTLGSVDFNGGTHIASSANTLATKTMQYNVIGNMDMNFANATDQVIMVNNFSTGGIPNLQVLNLNVGGDFITAGNSSGALFFSSGAGSAETADIAGNMNIGGGDIYFSGTETAGNGHNNTTNVLGNLTISAGRIRFSGIIGTADINITGNTTITGGEGTIKVNDGVATFDVGGNYSQTGGTFYLHKSSTDATANVVTVTIQGTFSETGTGIINFDPNTTSTATHIINLFGTSCTLGGTATMTHANAGTGTVFGEFYFARTGTTTYNRSSSTHYTQQVKFYVNSVCTVDASATTNDFQIASNSTENNIAGTGTNWGINVNGILDIGTAKITGIGPSLTGYYSGTKVNASARLRTSNLAGFYDGTTAACLQPQVFSGNTSYRMNFNLNATSYVEYYGNGNQVVTGKYPNAGALADVAIATTAQHHYGYLDINNQGTLGTNYCYPAIPAAGTGNVFVRTSLLLTRGELNLAGSGTGQTITIENGAASGITRDGTTTTGYIKSEEQNGGNNRAKVLWNMGAITGAHIYPFGVTTGATNYIPFTFNKTTAGSSNISLSTRISSGGSDNTPWAAVSNLAAVTTMESFMAGLADASVQSVIDRWWDITASAAVTADITFSFRGVENTTTDNPTGEFKAQHWNGTSWDAPVGTGFGVTGAAVGTVTATGQSTFSPWILSSLLIPLPVELSKFNYACENKTLKIEWETISETNNDYFSIEKSLDGFSYSKIAEINSTASLSSGNKYQFIDESPSKIYYRLSQTNTNGTNSVLKTFYFDKCETNNNNYLVYANESTIKVQTNSNESEELTISIFNTLGQIVKEYKEHKAEGFVQYEYKEDELSNGIYTIRVIGNNTIKSTNKIILSK